MSKGSGCLADSRIAAVSSRNLRAELLELFLLRLLEGGAGGQLRQLVLQAIDLAGQCLEPALGLLVPGREERRRPALPG